MRNRVRKIQLLSTILNIIEILMTVFRFSDRIIDSVLHKYFITNLALCISVNIKLFKLNSKIVFLNH